MSGRRQKQLRRLAKQRTSHLPEYDVEHVTKQMTIVNPDWKPGDEANKAARKETRTTVMLADCRRRVIKDLKRAHRFLKSQGEL